MQANVGQCINRGDEPQRNSFAVIMCWGVGVLKNKERKKQRHLVKNKKAAPSALA